APGHRWLAEAAGLAWLTTKIRAGSEIRGIYLRARSAEALRGRQAGCRLPIAAADRPSILYLDPSGLTEPERRAILDEIRAYEITQPWQQHYSSYNKRKTWTAFALHGYDAEDPGFIIKPAEMSREWKAEHPGRLGAPAR